nr:hypothetical protein [Streptomyces sp. DSM 41633]
MPFYDKCIAYDQLVAWTILRLFLHFRQIRNVDDPFPHICHSQVFGNVPPRGSLRPERDTGINGLTDLTQSSTDAAVPVKSRCHQGFQD